MAWSFDYRYWPLSRSRTASVILLAIAVTITGLFVKPNPVDPPLWWLLLIAPALLIWLAVTWADFMAQRRAGYRERPRYSEPDLDADS